MAKLTEILAKKTGGAWFSVADVITVPLTITEDITPVSEIREDESKKYFCVQVTNGKEIKDIHLARGALRTLAEIMPKDKTWKGSRFVINAISGKGFNTKTHMSLLTGDYNAAQGRLTDIPITQTYVPPANSVETAIADIVAFIGKAPSGIQDGALEKTAYDVCVDKGHVVKMSEIIPILKYGGRLKNENGFWKGG